MTLKAVERPPKRMTGDRIFEQGGKAYVLIIRQKPMKSWAYSDRMRAPQLFYKVYDFRFSRKLHIQPQRIRRFVQPMHRMLVTVMRSPTPALW